MCLTLSYRGAFIDLRHFFKKSFEILFACALHSAYRGAFIDLRHFFEKFCSLSSYILLLGSFRRLATFFIKNVTQLIFYSVSNLQKNKRQRAVTTGFLGLYLVFKDTSAYKKPCNRTEREALKIRIVMRFVAGCTKVLEPLSKTPRDNLYPLWELTKRLFMRFVALWDCLKHSKVTAVTNT